MCVYLCVLQPESTNLDLTAIRELIRKCIIIDDCCVVLLAAANNIHSIHIIITDKKAHKLFTN